MLKLYRSLIPKDIQILLAEASHSHSEAQWVIGTAALDIYEFITTSHEDGQMKMITTEQGFAAVGHYADTSGLRVRKIARVVGLFESAKEKHPDLTFGYFERAYDFGADEGAQFLEFCEEYEKDKGKQTFSVLTFVFRKSILGEDVERAKEVVYDPPDPFEDNNNNNSTEDVWDLLYRVSERAVATLHDTGEYRPRLEDALKVIREELSPVPVLEESN